MNTVAVERMEEFARNVLKLSPEMQADFFNEMVSTGCMSATEAEGLKQYVALYRMFTDQRYYNTVRDCVQDMYLAGINR